MESARVSLGRYLTPSGPGGGGDSYWPELAARRGRGRASPEVEAGGLFMGEHGYRIVGVGAGDTPTSVQLGGAWGDVKGCTMVVAR